MKVKFLMSSLTPLHISSGESYNKLEYMKIGEYLHIFDLSKIIDFLLAKGKYGNEIVYKFERNFESGIEGIIKEFNIKTEDITKFLKYKIKANFPVTSEVFTFIRHTDGRIYIPGSSIKGALRTPFFDEIIKSEGEKFIEKFINFNKNKNLEIADIEHNFESEIKRITRLGMSKGAKLENREVVSFKNIQATIDFSSNYDINQFIEKTNSFYIKILEHMIKKSFKYETFNKNLKNILNYIKTNSKNSIFLQVGFGGSFYSKSFGVFHENNDPDLVNFREIERIYLIRGKAYKPFPKTFASMNEVPMGWIKMEVLN